MIIQICQGLIQSEIMGFVLGACGLFMKEGIEETDTRVITCYIENSSVWEWEGTHACSLPLVHPIKDGYYTKLDRRSALYRQLKQL